MQHVFFKVRSCHRGHSEVEDQGGVTVLCSEDFGGGAFGSIRVFFIAC